MQHLKELEQQQQGGNADQQLFGGQSFSGDENEISEIMSGNTQWTTVESNENALE